MVKAICDTSLTKHQEHLEKSLKAIKVGGPFRAHLSINIREFIFEKNTMEIVNVGESSAIPLSFAKISELTLLVRNLGIECMRKSLWPMFHPFCTSENVYWSDFLNLVKLGKPTSIVQASAYIKALLQ